MKRISRVGKVLFFIVLFSLLFSSLSAGAAGAAPSTYTVSDKRADVYPATSVVTENGRSVRAKLIHDTTYIAVRDFAVALTAAAVTFDADTRTATVRAPGLSLTVADGAYAVYANGRVLFSLHPAVILSDGKLYAPVRTLAKAFGVGVTWQSAARRVLLSGSYRPIASADDYYDADAVFWLARIIHAESRGEPLLGQIAVGNVVLNRVASGQYPNTIWGVIFDRRFGVQFSPVADGSIYNTPDASCVLAAKICLEGFSLSDRVLFFLEPSKSTSFWITKNRPYAFTLGHHAFYF